MIPVYGVSLYVRRDCGDKETKIHLMGLNNAKDK